MWGRFADVIDDEWACPTPALVIDAGIADANLRRMQDRVATRGWHLRPHTKTHKTVKWAARQRELGADGLTVAKLGEAEVLHAAGLSPLLVAYPLVGQDKIDRLTRLLQGGADVTVSLDSRAAVDAVSTAAKAAGTRIGILVEVDTGFHRCGLSEVDDILALARYAAGKPGCRLDGLMCFGGHINRRKDPDEIRHLVRTENQVMQAAVAAWRAAGLGDPVVSVGGTVPAAYSEAIDVATELRPGTYIYNDVATVRAGAARWEDCAAIVVATVVSKPEAGRAVTFWSR